MKLPSMYIFTDVARTLFLNHERECQSWDTFTARARQAFGRTENDRGIFERQLNSRVQRPGETYASCIVDVPSLCRRAKEQTTEDESGRHLLKMHFGCGRF